MNGFRFHDPVWLLLAVPALLIVIYEVRRSRRSAVLYSSVQIMKTLPVTLAMRVRRTLPWIRYLGVACVIVSLARPQQGQEEFRIRTEGIAIEMVCDCSGSMQAMDFQEEGRPVDRLSAVKSVFRDFVAGTRDLPGRPDDLIGLVSFGGYAVGKCPLTLDHGVLFQVLDSVEVPKPVYDSRGRILNEALLQEEMATAIGDALALGVERLKKAEAKSKVLILLSDGESNAGVIEPMDAVAAAVSFGVKVYTIGVGSTGMAPFPRVDRYGDIVYVPSPVRLDEDLLREIASKTGGKYFNAKNTESLKDVYKEIDALEKTETEGRLYTEYSEHFQIFLFIGAGLIVLELLLSATRFRSLP